MSEEAAAAPAATEQAPIAPATVPVGKPQSAPFSVEDAAKAWSEARAKSLGPPETPKDPQPRVNGRFAKFEGETKETTNSVPEGADAGPETVPSEQPQDDPAEELPPIDPPRSWSKEDKDFFATLPRDTQERLSERERSRESDFLKRQNEAAEKSKSLEAKERAAEEARTQYEQAAQNSLQILQQQQANEFADIKTDADLTKLATEDPFRFIQWQARQQLLSRQYLEVQNLQRQREDERRQQFEAWSKEQDSTFEKQFPEFADKQKSGPLRASITAYLTKEVGVPEEALSKLWNTDLFRDAMWQRVVYDASRFYSAQQKAKSAVATKPPPVQRPSTAATKVESFEQAKEAAFERLKNSTGERALDAAVAAMRAKRKAG